MKRGKYNKKYKVDLSDLSSKAIIELVEKECSSHITIGIKNKDRVLEKALGQFSLLGYLIQGSVVLFSYPPQIRPQDLAKMNKFSGAQIIRYVECLTGETIDLSPKSRSSVLRHALRILEGSES